LCTSIEGSSPFDLNSLTCDKNGIFIAIERERDGKNEKKKKTAVPSSPFEGVITVFAQGM